MAPEQARGRERTNREGGSTDRAGSDITPATDVYALGAILYECLTGRPPFKAATAADTLLQVIGEEPVPPCRLQPKTPRDLEAIALKCLRKAPRHRYATAVDLADDLHRFRNGETIRALPVGRVERSVKWVRRNLVLAGALAAGALSLVAGTLVSTWFAVEAWEQSRKERDARERLDVARHALQMGQLLLSLEHDDLVAGKQILEDVPRQFQDTWEYRHLAALYRRLIALNRDGSHMATGGNGQVGEVRVRGDRMVQELTTLAGHKLTHRGVAVAVCSDGRHIVSGTRSGLFELVDVSGEVKLWDVVNGKELRVFGGHKSAATCFAVSKDDQWVAAGFSDGNVKVWETATGKELLTFRAHPGVVWGVAFSPDGKKVISAEEGKLPLEPGFGGANSVYHGAVKVSDVATGKELLSLKCDARDKLLGLAVSPDGKRIVTAATSRSGEGPGEIKVWDASSGRELLDLPGHAGAGFGVVFSDDGKWIVSGDRSPGMFNFPKLGKRLGGGRLTVWDAATGLLLLSCKGHVGCIASVAVSRDGKRIVSGGGFFGRPGEIKLWDALTGQEVLSLKGHSNIVTSVAFTPDGRRIISGSADGTVKVWDAP
jgi:WD40 repeat protein